ncbi:MAG: DNA-3-methyladenine glycosylase I [Pseudomonadota bacterium]
MSDEPSPSGLITGQDGQQRCWWCGADPQYVAYHDTEWGFPVTDDTRLFEKICLEGFQSGLSWLTILRKRENFRAAFAGFNIETVARYTSADVDRLVQDAGIIRHRGKIEATINNAQRAIALIEECGSLAAYVWRYEPAPSERPKTLDRETLGTLAKTAQSIALAKDLKQRGWKFFGPTTAYAFMQAMGLVNDHMEGCHVREQALKARAALVVPS